MTTLVFADFDSMGGTRTYLKRLVEYLSSRSRIVVAARRGMFDRDIVAFLRQNGAGVVRLGGGENLQRLLRRLVGQRIFDALERRLGAIARRTGLPALLAMKRECRLMRGLACAIKPDLVFVSQGGGSRYYAALSLDQATVLSTHSLNNGPPLSRSSLRFLGALVGPGKLANKRIVSDCDAARQNIDKHLVSLQPGGISRFIYNHGGSIAEKPHRDQEVPVTILTLGHVTGYKSPELWIRVAKEVTRRSRTAVQFLWTGDGNLLDKCRNATRNDAQIRFLGRVESVDVYYRGAAIYFQPSELENHPISVVEAMKWSLPCVVSTVGGLPECVRDEENGYVVDIEDFEKIVRRIQALVEKGELREMLGINSRRRFEEMFSVETWTRSMDGLISEIFPAWMAR